MQQHFNIHKYNQLKSCFFNKTIFSKKNCKIFDEIQRQIGLENRNIRWIRDNGGPNFKAIRSYLLKNLSSHHPILD